MRWLVRLHPRKVSSSPVCKKYTVCPRVQRAAAVGWLVGRAGLRTPSFLYSSKRPPLTTTYTSFHEDQVPFFLSQPSRDDDASEGHSPVKRGSEGDVGRSMLETSSSESNDTTRATEEDAVVAMVATMAQVRGCEDGRWARGRKQVHEERGTVGQVQRNASATAVLCCAVLRAIPIRLFAEHAPVPNPTCFGRGGPVRCVRACVRACAPTSAGVRHRGSIVGRSLVVLD